MTDDQSITIKHLYPQFTEEQLAEAAENLRCFAQVMAEIYRERAAEAHLTAPESFSMIPSERSNPNLNHQNDPQ